MKTNITDEEIHAIHQQAKQGVKVFCDENHAHTAVGGCLAGNAKDIDICKLAEVILKERTLMRNAVALLGEEA
jgi:hypothetical protein